MPERPTTAHRRAKPIHVHRPGAVLFGNQEPKRRSSKHVVARVDFAEAQRQGIPSEHAPLWCSCGWSGKSVEFTRHRAEQGERRVYGTGGRGRQDAA